jgi:uncharacterized protein
MTKTTELLLKDIGLESFFDDTSLGYDLREGVLWNPAKTRLCMLSSDFLDGVYKSLVDEAGPAWATIFKSCGRIWGEKVMKRLERECSLVGNVQLNEVPLTVFLGFFREYFVFHGWGLLDLDVSRARETGIVTATLEDSIFAEIIRDEEEFSDPMIAGILAGMLSYVSSQKLDCVQTACISRGEESSRFIITAEPRLKDAEDRVKAGMTHDQLVEAV